MRLHCARYFLRGLLLEPPPLLEGEVVGVELLEGELSVRGDVRGASRTGDSERGRVVGSDCCAGFLSRVGESLGTILLRPVCGFDGLRSRCGATSLGLVSPGFTTSRSRLGLEGVYVGRCVYG